MDLREPLIEATKKLKALREELDELHRRAAEPIAIVAAACRLPGGIDSPERYWDVLEHGRDAVEPFPAARWNRDELYDADPDIPGKTYCTQGGFVRNVDCFDAGFFGIAPREAAAMDPAQRIALECSWEVLERAGIRPADLAQSQTGVYVGAVGSDYEPWGGRRGMEGMDGYGFTGRDGSVMSGRISYTLGLNGPAMTINTACSSSLVALHLACKALRSGEADLALAGGSQVMTTPGCFVEFSRLRGMSQDGRCKSFSDDADGVGWAEGCAVLLLQRLSDAQREGRPVLAIVRGTAVNQDGRSQGLTAPNGAAQERVIARALAESGLIGDDIDAVEAHGTGTALGDPIEAGALAAVFGRGRPAERPLLIGSCKSNIGHTQAASGVAGVMKIVLALAHEQLPRSLHVREPNRRVRWDGSGLRVLTEARPWKRGERVRRAGVNSFGISGTNAHVIVEEAPAQEARRDGPDDRAAAGPVPLLLSGTDDAALAEQAVRLADHLEHHPDLSALDVAYSLATARTHLPARLAVAVRPDGPVAELAATLRDGSRAQTRTLARRPGKLVMLFSGQGSQRPQMGKQLYRSHPAFREALDEIRAELDRWLPRPLTEVMFAAPGTEAAGLLDQTEYTQPALFALEVALYRQWERYGLVPNLLLGHSVGELAAAHVAGVLSLADACALVAARGRLMQRARTGGAMYSIGAPDAEVAEHLLGLEDRLAIAAVNGPEQTVISGDAAAAEAVARKLEEKGRRVHRLRVSHAFHSPHMDGILEEYRAVAAGLSYRAPTLALISNLNGAVADADLLGSADYWVRQVRGAVRFREAVRTAEAAGADRYLECGPSGVLAAMTASCATSATASFVASLQAGRDEAESLAEAITAVHVTGAALRWDEVFAGRGARRVDTPTYGFQRAHYWLDGAGREERDLEGAGMVRVAHEMLGAELSLPDGGHLVTARVSRARVPWIADHRVFDQVIVPGMSLLELVVSAGARSGASEVRSLTLEAPLILESAVQLQITVDPADADGLRAFRVHARPAVGGDAPWRRHASGLLGTGDPPAERAVPVAPADAARVDLTGLYERLAARGLDYGPAFRGLRELHRWGDQLLARVVLPAPLEADGYAIHPVLLDASLHAVLAVSGDDELRIPLEVEQVRLAPRATTTGLRELRVHLALGTAEAAISFYDIAGLVAEVGRVAFRAVSREKLGSSQPAVARPKRGDLYRVEWTPQPLRAVPRGAACALVGSGPLSNEVATVLRGSSVHLTRYERTTDVDATIPTVVRVLDPGSHESSAASALAATTQMVGEMQAWIDGARLTDQRYVLLTSQAVATNPSGMGGLAHAPLWGLLRTVRNETPERTWLALDTDGSDASHQILPAALFGAEAPELALRKGECLVARLTKADAAPAGRPQFADGTVLVTGGTSGLGAAVAKHLAARHGVKHLLLASRRGAAAPGVSELVAELLTSGCNATVVACDVAERAQVEQMLAAIPDEHPLTGVFHCAAVLDDAMTLSISADRIARVFGPKVAGAWHLHQLTQRRPLAAFVLFSSVAGLIGNEGQGVYSAANTFLDALSEGRRALGLAAHSLAWGAWDEVGMAARLTDRHQDRIRRSGLIPMSPATALDLMDRALGNPDHLLAPLLLDEQLLRRPDAPPIGRLLFAAPPAPAATATAMTAAPPTLRSRLDGATPEERARILMELVRTEVMNVLELPDASALHEDRLLAELGVDSLMAVDIRRRLERRLSMRLPATIVFDHPACRPLVEYLLSTWRPS